MDLSRKPSLRLCGGIACVFALLIGAKAFWVDGVLLRVNSQVTTLADFNGRLAEARAELQAPVPEGEEAEFKRKLMDSILEEMLLMERAKDLGQTASKGDVDRALEMIRKRNQFPDLDTVDLAAQQAGMSKEALLAQIERQILMERVMGAEVFPQRDVTEWELRQYYETIKDKDMIPEAFRLREIALLAGPGLDARRAAVEKALADGTAFEEAARQHSQSPTADKGGDLGAVQPGDLSEALQAALKTLKPGETSAAIATPFGLHYLHLVEIIPAHPRPFDELRDQLPDRVFREKYRDNIAEYLKGLKSRYHVVVNDRLLTPPEAK